MIMETAEILASDEYSKRCGKYSNSPAVRYAYRLRLKLVREVLRGHSGCTLLLDLGSGSGDYAADLAEEMGLTAYLLDINHQRLFVASHKSQRILSVQAEATNIPFGDNTFDFVLAMNSLRYFNSPSRTLLECRRILQPRGLLLIIDHNKLSPEVFFLGRERTRCFTPGSLANLVRASHFQVITMKMLFIMPSSIPSFLINVIAKAGHKLSRVLSKIYPEIFVLAAKE